jgi:hypothetical protein
MKKEFFSLIVGCIVTIASAQERQTQFFSYPQGGFIAGRYGIEASYNINNMPAGAFGGNQIRVGGKFDHISLGVGLHERQQPDFADTKARLSSFAIDLGYNWVWYKKFGLNTMLMQTFSNPVTLADNSTNTIIKESVSTLSLLLYKQFDFGRFFIKPCIGYEANLVNKKMRIVEEILGSEPIILEKQASPLFSQVRIGLGLGLNLNNISIFAMPFLYSPGGYRIFGGNIGAAYNFKTETTFDGKTK